MEIANERYAGESPLSESPNEAVSLIIGDNTVSTPKLQDKAVTTEKINDKAVTPEKLSDRVNNEVIKPAVNQAKNELNRNIQDLADKEARDINAVQQDYGNKINALSGSVTNQINTLRQDCNRKYNILDQKIDNSTTAISIQLSAKINAVDDKQTKKCNDLQKQITNNLKIYNKQRATDMKSIKDQLGAFRDKDKDLQNQIDAIQIGGWAISQMFGQDTHIGISQNALTNLFGRLWEVLGEIKGKNYMDFTLTVDPEVAYNEGSAQVSIIADCTDTISYFDSIKIYVNDVLVDEAAGVNLLSTVVEIDDTSIVKAVGVLVGKTITKEKRVIQDDPFFIGSAPEDYHDVMTQENWHKIQGTLEGDYDFSVQNNNDHIFVIIPASRREEYRRCKMDMNGFEIPFNVTEENGLIICKSQNTYVQGNYNLDIDINS
jgi:hypothetical protein